jgi:hypothetical protein
MCSEHNPNTDVSGLIDADDAPWSRGNYINGIVAGEPRAFAQMEIRGNSNAETYSTPTRSVG